MNDYMEISFRLLIALGFGGLVGLERSYHGRPAGFRTHTLVCLASAALMLVTVTRANGLRCGACNGLRSTRRAWRRES